MMASHGQLNEKEGARGRKLLVSLPVCHLAVREFQKPSSFPLSLLKQQFPSAFDKRGIQQTPAYPTASANT